MDELEKNLPDRCLCRVGLPIEYWMPGSNRRLFDGPLLCWRSEDASFGSGGKRRGYCKGLSRLPCRGTGTLQNGEHASTE